MTDCFFPNQCPERDELEHIGIGVSPLKLCHEKLTFIGRKSMVSMGKVCSVQFHTSKSQAAFCMSQCMSYLKVLIGWK